MVTAKQIMWQIERELEQAERMGVDPLKVKARLSKKWEDEYTPEWAKENHNDTHK